MERSFMLPEVAVIVAAGNIESSPLARAKCQRIVTAS
jgi:hypothetical protein